MKYRVLCIFLYCLCLRGSLLAQQSASPKTYALVIGISSYQSKALPSLQYADKDAGLFAGYLKSAAGGSVPPKQIRLLQNDKASIAAIYDALDWLKEQCKKDDKVYFYFSGHGDLETEKKTTPGYLLAYNTPPNNYVNNAISIQSLNDAANALTLDNGANVILITDACHSGKLAGDFFKGKQYAAGQLSKVMNNEVRLAACAAHEEAAEGADWGGGRGVFSYYLLSGLAGKADSKHDSSIQLWEINKYLDSSFAADKFLRANKHQQTPVTDGNAAFQLAVVDPAFVSSPRVTGAPAGDSSLPAGLRTFSAQSAQAIDVFFSEAKELPLESMLPFSRYLSLPADSIASQLVADCIAFQISGVQLVDYSRSKTDTYGYWDTAFYRFSGVDTLELLQKQLSKSKVLAAKFSEQLVQMIQDKCQDMINAYLRGDLAELERRQYYYAGRQQYDDFLPMLRLARLLVPPTHRLARVLAVDDNYIAGLICRMKMATESNPDSLLQAAFAFQQTALSLEPYAAYIHNELGNLFLHQNNSDSANYHFSLASVLAPSWAVPWSNKIRLNLAVNNLLKAKEAIQKSDSLQPNLSFTLLNAGLVMERDSNWLEATNRYSKAIALNRVHFLPFERLGMLYINTGDYGKADANLYEAAQRKKGWVLNHQYFDYGVELGGIGSANINLDAQMKHRLQEHYKLADQYLAQKRWDKAAAQYILLSRAENQWLKDQAAYKDYPSEAGSVFDYEDLIDRYEGHMVMSGAILLARLYERLGKYEEAEKVLLNQVALNREAGFTRQSALDRNKPGTWQMTGFKNYEYWLDINRDLEAETYRFYQSVMHMFPRDYRWKEKAGLFLYQRLAMTFDQVPAEQFTAFSHYTATSQYPWHSGENISAAEDSAVYILPGSHDTLRIQMPVYNPIKDALEYLQQW